MSSDYIIPISIGIPIIGYVIYKYRALMSPAICKTCTKTCCHMCKEKCSHNCKLIPLNDTTYELSFRIGFTSYKHRFNLNNDPNELSIFTNDEDKDVTTLIEPYFNYNNLRPVTITPIELGYKQVIVENLESSKTYNENEIILLIE